MTGTQQIVLRVLFFQDPHDPNVWNAQALEHDIAAFGADVAEAKRAFEATVSGYLRLADDRKSDLFDMLKPAPVAFFEAWHAMARQQVAARQQVGAEWIPSVETWMLPVVTYDPIPATH